MIDISPQLVRTATFEDRPAVVRLANLPERHITIRLHLGDILLAEQHGEIVGLIILDWLWSSKPFISLITVERSFRRMGIGRSLLLHLESLLASRGEPYLYSSSQENEPHPQAWHRRMGFEQCGAIHEINRGGVDEIFFRKRIV